MSTTVPSIVDPTYRHSEKIAVPQATISRMKWFDLLEDGRTIDDSTRTDARRRVEDLIDPDDDPTRASYCVWELGIVNAERQAWADFLRSTRDEAALGQYLAASYSGVV